MVAGLNLAPISSISGAVTTRPDILVRSRLSHEGMLLLWTVSPTILKYSLLRPRDVQPTSSPGLSTCEGMPDLRPFTVMWPWRTSCRAWVGGGPQPPPLDHVVYAHA